MRQEMHRPPHLYESRATYFIAAHTYGGIECFATDRRKALLMEALREATARSQIGLIAWVLLDDHYHLLLVTSPQAQSLARLIRAFHSMSAIAANRLDGSAGRRVWYQYWDRCPRTEAEFRTCFNYIHQNPRKHGYISELGDLHETLSQYRQRRYGVAFLEDIWRRYPVADFFQTE